ncbi:MAG: MlaD family protein, partial [Burkholderiales bacterium]
MEPEAKYTLVGAAVLMLLALIVVAAVWLEGSGGEGDTMPYKIYFERQSLEGLQIRSDVKMQGIKVGAVTGFRISARRPGSVEVVIRVDSSAPVHQGTRATVERQLLTGIANIRLTNADEGSP